MFFCYAIQRCMQKPPQIVDFRFLVGIVSFLTKKLVKCKNLAALRS